MRHIPRVNDYNPAQNSTGRDQGRSAACGQFTRSIAQAIRASYAPGGSVSRLFSTFYDTFFSVAPRGGGPANRPRYGGLLPPRLGLCARLRDETRGCASAAIDGHGVVVQVIRAHSRFAYDANRQGDLNRPSLRFGLVLVRHLAQRDALPGKPAVAPGARPRGTGFLPNDACFLRPIKRSLAGRRRTNWVDRRQSGVGN